MRKRFRLQYLQQKTSAFKYAAKFQKHVNVIEWDDVALMTMFCKDFKNNVKNEFMRYKESFKIMNNLIEVTIELDDKLYERVIKKRYYKSNKRTDIYVECNTDFREESQRFEK